MNKLSVFNPDFIVDTGFGVGRHSAVPIGRVHLPPRDELMLLHYKYLGFERTLARHREECGGLGATDLANQWGIQYLWDAPRLRSEWEGFAARALDVSASDFKPWEMPARERHWRPPGFQDAAPRLVHRLGLRSGLTRL